MEQEFKYTRFSPEELAEQLDFRISSTSSLQEIKRVLQRKDGIVYIIDGFKVYLHHMVHSLIMADNLISEENKVLPGAIYGSQGNIRVELFWDKDKMREIFGIPESSAPQYEAAIEKNIKKYIEGIKI